MTLKDRVLEYCKLKKIAISAFERKSGLSNGYFNSVANRPSESTSLGIDWLP